MLLSFSDAHKEDLLSLREGGEDALKEQLGLALDSIRNGSSSSSSSKVIEALSQLLLQSAKMIISEIDFLDSFMLLAFPQPLTQLIWKFHVEHYKEVRSILAKLSMDLPHYHNIEWRLDVQLASRSLRRQVDPLFTLRLDIKDGEEMEHQYLQVDPVNLNHIIQSLEGALSEMKGAYSRRIMRNVK